MRTAMIALFAVASIAAATNSANRVSLNQFVNSLVNSEKPSETVENTLSVKLMPLHRNAYPRHSGAVSLGDVLVDDVFVSLETPKMREFTSIELGGCYDGHAFISKFGLKSDHDVRSHYIKAFFSAELGSRILAQVGDDNCLKSVTISPMQAQATSQRSPSSPAIPPQQ